MSLVQLDTGPFSFLVILLSQHFPLTNVILIRFKQIVSEFRTTIFFKGSLHLFFLKKKTLYIYNFDFYLCNFYF